MLRIYAIIVCLVCSCQLHAAADSYVDKMPSPAKVESEVQGADVLDTKARQIAAYHILSDVITTIVSQTRSWAFTEKEKKCNATYSGVATQLTLSVYGQLDPSGAERLKEGTPSFAWKKKEEAYENDEYFARKVVSELVPSDAAAIYTPLRSKRKQEAEAYLASPEYKQIQATQQQSEDEYKKEQAAERGKTRTWTLRAFTPVMYIISFILWVVIIPVLVTRRSPYTYEPPILKARKTYTVHSLSGTVIDASKLSSTHVYSSGGYYNSATGTYSGGGVQSSVTIKDQIFLIDDKGREHSVQLYDWDVAARASHAVTVMWAVEEGQVSGEYIAVLNHTTHRKYLRSAILRGLLRPSIGWAYPVIVLLLLLLPLIVLLLSLKMRSLSILMHDEFTFLYLWSWLFLLLGVLVAATLLTRYTQRQVRRFENDIRFEDFASAT